MSFKCQSCKKQQKVGTAPITVVSKKRNKFYPEIRNRDNEVIASRGKGWEIVRELNCCAKCAPLVESRCYFVKAG